MRSGRDRKPGSAVPLPVDTIDDTTRRGLNPAGPSSTYGGEKPSKTRLHDPNRVSRAEFVAAEAGNALAVVDHHFTVLFADSLGRTVFETYFAPGAH